MADEEKKYPKNKEEKEEEKKTDAENKPDEDKTEEPKPPFPPYSSQMMMTVYAGPDYWNGGQKAPAGAFRIPSDEQKTKEKLPSESGLYCSNCGMPLPADAIFCSECGTKVIK